MTRESARLDHIRSLYAYNHWATARFVALFDRLEEPRLTAHHESSFPSLLATFAHLVGAEWVWLRRFRGESPADFPAFVAHPKLSELRATLAEVESERDAFLATLGEEELEAPLSYRSLSGKAHRDRLFDLLVHVVNHSTYHRGQLTTLLRQVGATPVATDYVAWVRESRG